MSVNQRILETLAPLGFPVVPDLYSEKADKYITFNYTARGASFADDAPQYDICLVQVHFFCPHDFDSVETRKAIRRRLFETGFTWPEEVNATGDYRESAKEGQHYVFECEIEEGVLLDG